MAYSSVAPVLIVPYYIVLIFFWNTYKPQWNLGILLTVALLLNELVLKNIIKEPWPAGACADSYGMPSSHAGVMMILFIYQIN